MITRIYDIDRDELKEIRIDERVYCIVLRVDSSEIKISCRQEPDGNCVFVWRQNVDGVWHEFSASNNNSTSLC